VPKLQLRFDGATLDLPRENYVFPVEDKNNGQNYTCIAILYYSRPAVTTTPTRRR
jgi:hypothetical protein